MGHCGREAGSLCGGPSCLSFYLAGSLPLDLDFKQKLLALRSEGERLALLIKYLQDHHSQFAAGGAGTGEGGRQRACALNAGVRAGSPRIIQKSISGGSFMSLPRTLGDLRRSSFSEERLRTRRVKDELRDNLIARLRKTWTMPAFSPALWAMTTRWCRRL